LDISKFEKKQFILTQGFLLNEPLSKGSSLHLFHIFKARNKGMPTAVLKRSPRAFIIPIESAPIASIMVAIHGDIKREHNRRKE
jgi:hypothetical protein